MQQVIEEYPMGIEDRVYRTVDGWYWQARGSINVFGPFSTRDDAEDDYRTSNPA